MEHGPRPSATDARRRPAGPAGTAAIYPTLIAQVSDLVAPRSRASAVGIYRLWRDLGHVAGALIGGVMADALGLRAAIGSVAALTAVSGLVAGRHLPESAPHVTECASGGAPTAP